MNDRLTVRLAATLGLVLTIDLLLAAGLVVLLEPWVTPTFARIGITSTVGFVSLTLCVVLVLVAMQIRYTRRELLAEANASVARADDRELKERLTRLAVQADMPVPSIAIADTAAGNSMAIGGFGAGTVVLSRGLLETLADDELDAVLAHELVHLKNRDAVVMTVATFVPALVANEYSPFDGLPRYSKPATVGALALLATVLAGTVLDAPVVTPAGFLQFLVATAVTVGVGGVVLGILAAATALTAGSLSRCREFVADRGGSRLTGDPAALASALETLARADDRPSSDKRHAVRQFCLLPYGFDVPTETAGGIGSGLEIRTHPPVEKRIDRLREQVRRIETGTT
ncbi:M48 family metallopeptidase [Halovivax limisalsi]|uniref:M48 family metallopeptidase n=1 Tax=Halovivax limisalsi TaxID=1453760 RepID=UPI001FFDD3BB|nr:M48 family metalloprotease [Halovivax limisalsi]